MITENAINLFEDYLRNYPEAANIEAKAMRANVQTLIENPAKYFAIELKEPEHAVVVLKIQKNNGVMNFDAMATWVQQNWFEVYMLKKK